MAKILPIIKIGAEILRTKSKRVDEITYEVKELAEDMMLTMLACQGVGLAANQVNKDLCVITIASMDFVGHMINPVLKELSQEIMNYSEGCLSVPAKFLNTGVRSQKIRVEYQDVDGVEHSTLFSGATSVIIQHEMDHLDGVLFVDYLRKEKR